MTINSGFLTASLAAITMTPVSKVALAEPVLLLSQQPRTNQIAGKIISIDDDDFILDTGNQQIKVDAKSRPIRQAKLAVGEQVTVTGTFDDHEFEARTIVRSNGEVILIRD